MIKITCKTGYYNYSKKTVMFEVVRRLVKSFKRLSRKTALDGNFGATTKANKRYI